MRQVTTVFLLLLALVSANVKDKTEEDFIKAGEQCFKQLKVPESYKSKFDSFDYPDESIVHKYLLCILTDVEVWNDKNGLDVDHIVDYYKDKANSEVLLPIVTDCNRNTQNDPALKWMYRAFKCIMDSQVGTYFKENIAKHTKSS